MKYILLASALLIVLSCNKVVNKNSSYNDLPGEWTTSAELNDGEYKLLYVLRFEDDNDFSWKITSFKGIDSSFTYLYLGTFLAHKNNISFNAKELQTWDKSNSTGWLVKKTNQSLFDSCKYQIKGDTLQLDYILYPTDRPYPTQAIYTRMR